MRVSRILLGVAASLSLLILADISSAQNGEYSVVERGQHHQVWRKVTPQTNELGRITWRTNQFTQLATGLNRLQNGQYVESAPEIVIDGNRAIARGAGHEAIFAGNANSANAIQIKTPEGAWLKGRIYGLAYHDVAAGTNVLIAELQDSAGQLVGTNKVRYPDAFTDIEGVDVEYIYKKSGLSQWIVFRGSPPPTPEAYGLNPEKTHLLVLTEFTEFPVATVRKRQWTAETERVEDETVSFGASMRMARGQAFEIRNGMPGKRRVDVMKRWQVLDGRYFLIERVRYREIKRELQSLPADDASSVTNGTASVNREARWFADGTLPETEGAAANGTAGMRPRDNAAAEWHFAKLETPNPESESDSGFVLDWEYVYEDTWFEFACYNTYIVSDTVYLGSATFQPGAVLKYEPWGSLRVAGAVNWVGTECNGTTFTILTSINDDTVPEEIDWYTGDPEPYGPALVVEPQYYSLAVSRTDVRYANPGVVANLPIVTTIATDQIATKGTADTGTFRITRSGGDWSQALTVQFTVTGTATAGTDYESLGASAIIPVNQGSVLLPVNALNPLGPNGGPYDATVVITLQPNAAYQIVSPLNATVTLYDPTIDSPPPAAAPAGLVAWWRGEHNALDSVASYHGTIYGTIDFSYGKVAQGFQFHSVLSERIKVNDADALDFGANADFSIEAWIKADQNPPPTAYGVQTIVDKRYSPNDSTATGYALFLLNGNLYCQLGVNGGAANFGSTGPDLRDGQLHHVAVTVDRDNPEGLKLYVDGVSCGNPLNNPTTKSGSLANGDFFRIGTHAREALNAPFKGIIDEVSLYNRALLEADIQSVYSSGRGGKGAQGVSITALDTEIDEASGTGTFRITRSSDNTDGPLTVNLQVGGTATAGLDYLPINNQTTIPKNKTFVDISLNPLKDFLVESPESVTLTLMSGTGYFTEGNITATITISDGLPPEHIITVQPASSLGCEDSGKAAVFSVFRSNGRLSAPLTVHFSIGGTATEGTDYSTLTRQVTIQADAGFATVVVNPLSDGVNDEGPETVTLTATSGANYTIGDPDDAMVHILDTRADASK